MLYQRTLALDPKDAYAHLGLGRVAAREKRLDEAEESLRMALALDDTLPDTWRALGTVLAKRKVHKEAILAYEQSLMLVLHGQKPLTETIITQPPDDFLFDPDHCAIHVDLARLYEATGALTRAISGYRLGIAGGEDNALVRFRLVRLYLKKKQWRQAIYQIWRAARMIPVGACQKSRRAAGRLGCAIRRLFDTLW
jgi:tetratricopeptide (TPR) repeat protein